MPRKGVLVLLLGMLAVAATVGATAVPAAITGTSGSVVQIAPPPSVVDNALQSDTDIKAFDEKQCVTLASDLQLDVTPGGGGGSVPAGTTVSSQFLHFDPSGSSFVTRTGSITTDAAIIGAITTSGNLDASDSLGAPATAYPTGDATRDLEPAQGDTVSISGNQLTATTTVNEQFHFDQIRVITHCPPPPPPVLATCVENVNPHGQNIPPAGSTTLPGPKGGQNEDGFYKIGSSNGSAVTVVTGGVTFGPFPSGSVVKYTQAPGSTPTSKKIGSENGQAGAVIVHITGPDELVVVSSDGSRQTCLVPPPPK
jgi:hypothetical protein